MPGPKPTDKAILRARGSWRGKLKDPEEQQATLQAPARDTARYWSEESRTRRREMRVRAVTASALEVDAWARDLFALLPGYDPIATARPEDRWSSELAREAIDFFPSELQLIEGHAANKPFRLERWQQAITACLFGWLRADGSEEGTRRYREAFIYVPRKNGKTPWCAGIVNLVLFQDHEPGAQLYAAAADLQQAALVYRHTSGMIVRNPEMMARTKIYRTFKSVELPDEGSIFKALSADADTKHGLGAQLVIIDELHAHRDGELVEVLATSTAARREPLMIYITTADYARESICNRKYSYAMKVRDGVLPDPSFLPVIFEATLDDDWTAPEIWSKANPNLGVSVQLEYLARQCRRAQDEPSFENTFKRLHLNIRTQQDQRWLSLQQWQACGGKVDEAALAGRACFAGMDLSTKIDLSCYALLFLPTEADKKWRTLLRFYIPEDNARARERRDRVPYLTWADQGFLRMTPHNAVDYDRIRADLLEDAKRFEIREVAYDPWNATEMATKLLAEGAQMVEFRQGFASMSEPTKELERLVMTGELAHGNHPVLNWMASHVAIEFDAAGNAKLSKRKSTEKIDGLVAIVMALGRALLRPVAEPQIYFI